ncbi:MAG: hypothetical protein JWN44_1547 [Myxococcales bacterium]|nr:hypothetical protein [Myxococcales bacterium]
MSMKHPLKNHDAASKKRRVKQQRLKEEKKERRLQMAEARAKQK